MFFKIKPLGQTGKLMFPVEIVAWLLCFPKLFSAEIIMYLVMVQSRTKRIKAALLSASFFCKLITPNLNIWVIKEALEIGCFTGFIKYNLTTVRINLIAKF